jgi:hypothetical protein
MQIYNLQETYEERWILDPVTGPAKRREAVVKPSGMDRISVPAGVYASCPQGKVFEVQPDGTFEVPQDIGEFYVRQPGWHSGASPFPSDDLPPSREPLRPLRVTKAHQSRP